MSHAMQSGLIGGALFVGGMIFGTLVQKLYAAWKRR